MTRAIALPMYAEPALMVVYPPAVHQTTAERIFLIGTAPPSGEVLVNGQQIERSSAGHFAPTLPLKLGDNLLTIRYQNQQIQIKVKRLATIPELPTGLAFGKDSLTPAVDIARLPRELICFSAIAPANATVLVQLGIKTIPLLPQLQQVQLPANSAVLTGQNQPSQFVAGQYQGCAILPETDSNPQFRNNIITNTVASSTNVVQPEFKLTLNGKTIAQQGTGKITVLDPTQLPVIEVTADVGVARTGPGTDYSRLTPLPTGTRASITGWEGEWLRLDYGGWINRQETRGLPGAVPPRSLIRSISTRQVPGATEVILPLQVPVPVRVQQGDRAFTLTLYNTTAQTDTIRLDDNPVISRLDWQQVAPNQVQYSFNLKSQQQWGYKLRYEGTSLVLTLRHPPLVKRAGAAGVAGEAVNRAGGAGAAGVAGEAVNRAEGDEFVSTHHSPLTTHHSPLTTHHSPLTTHHSPLTGIKILLDPGHGGAELGARGPTGYAEKDVNLTIAQLVKAQLEQRGAIVYMTREEDRQVSLLERVTMIDKLEPAIALSLHYNALPDNGDAMNTKGLSTYWYHPQAHSLAVFLHNYLVKQLNRPDYGVYWHSLALTRPTTAPSVLLELGFIINPTEFEWIVNPQAQKQLAAAIAQGITKWFHQ